MAKITKETIITDGVTASPTVVTPVVSESTNTQTAESLIYYVLGALEILLTFRLVLKLMGAGTASFFVRLIYSIAGLFILPFEGIFRRGFTQGLETTSVLEPSTLVAIIVYPLLAWGIVKLVRISSRTQSES
jgi:uncharacterized membrane protein YuzA (DUF378 family)